MGTLGTHGGVRRATSASSEETTRVALKIKRLRQRLTRSGAELGRARSSFEQFLQSCCVCDARQVVVAASVMHGFGSNTRSYSHFCASVSELRSHIYFWLPQHIMLRN